MIPRYTPPPFKELWSTETRYRTWLEVELAACEAMEKAGSVPKGTSKSIRKCALELRAERIDEIERVTRHDVIAFLTHVEELVGEKARVLHRGMTSSDVLDTSFALLLVRASDLLLERLRRVILAFKKRAAELADVPMIGRSHGISAEPVTFGLALAGHLAEFERNEKRLLLAREEIAVGKIAGAVGTYAHLSPEIEKAALGSLGLRGETVSTQIVARDRHAAFFQALALLGAAIERFATNVRHWQRSEVGEAEEAFGKGQKGSSAMPHKRNPIVSENLCGLARLLRGYVVSATENVALWHERDISHSSVERVIAPDATATLGFMLERTADLVENLVVFAPKLDANLVATKQLYCSEAVLLALVDAGVGRQAGYVLVQRNAMKTWGGEGGFLANLLADKEVRSHLSEKSLRACFDLEHTLRHVPAILKRAGVRTRPPTSKSKAGTQVPKRR